MNQIRGRFSVWEEAAALRVKLSHGKVPYKRSGKRQDGDRSPASMASALSVSTFTDTISYILCVLFPPMSSYLPESTEQEGPWCCGTIRSRQLCGKSKRTCFSEARAGGWSALSAAVNVNLHAWGNSATDFKVLLDLQVPKRTEVVFVEEKICRNYTGNSFFVILTLFHIGFGRLQTEEEHASVFGLRGFLLV